MRDPWIRQHFGPEVNPRRRFGEALADDLVAAWHEGSAPAAPSPPAIPAPAAGAAGTGAATDDDVWASTRPETAAPSPATTRIATPLQRRPMGAPPPSHGRRWIAIGLAVAGVAALVAAFVVRQSNDSTATGTPGVTVPGGSTLPGGSTAPGQTLAPGATTLPAGTATTVDGSGAQGSQYLDPACHETRPTTAIPAAVDPALLAAAGPVPVDPTLSVQLPELLNGATYDQAIDVRVVDGGVLVKVAAKLPDGSFHDTMLSVVNNDGAVRWTRCFTNAYTIGPFGENGDGSVTIWVARASTALARYVNLATGDTTELASGYSPPADPGGATPGVTWKVTGIVLGIWFPDAAALGSHELSLP